MSRSALQKLFAALELAEVDYVRLHRATTAFFAARGCGADSEALADVTLLDRLARKVDEGIEIENFVAYSKKIAKLVYLEYLKDREKFRRAARELMYLRPDVQNPEEEPDLRRRCQESCVGGLSESERQLMVDYYLTGKTLLRWPQDSARWSQPSGRASTGSSSALKNAWKTVGGRPSLNTDQPRQ